MHEINFLPLLIITTLAFFIPLITAYVTKVNIPVVVGEIICGIIIGKSGFNIISADPWLEFLSIFGFTFLMFLSGMEIDLSFLKKTPQDISVVDREINVHRHDPFILGGKVFAITISLSFLLSYLLYQFDMIQDPLFLTLILSTTSVGIVVPTLRELGINTSVFGQDILFASLVADFLTMLLITVYVAKISTGLSPEILLIILIFVAFIVVYKFSKYILGKQSTMKTLQKESMQRTEIKTRAAFAMMILFIVLSQEIGIEIILGAFLAGFLISLLSNDSDLALLHGKLNGVGFGFFIPLFFIMVGVRFDLKPILENPGSLILLPAFLLAAYMVKIVPAMLLSKHYSMRNSISAGVLLASRLTLIIAAADIGKALGVVSPSTYSIIILVAVITSTMSPIIFNKVQRLSSALNLST